MVLHVPIPGERRRLLAPMFGPETQTSRPWALLAVETLIGGMAVPCGIGLILFGLGIPKEQLEGTPFHSFLVPGLLLSGVVGGSMLTAALAVWRRLPLGPLLSLAAGAILLGWIVVEALLIHDGRPLQAFIFLSALLTLALSWRYRLRSAL